MLRTLERLGIDTAVLQILVSQGTESSIPAAEATNYHIQTPEHSQHLDPSSYQPQLWGFDNMDVPDGFEISPEVFEAVSSLEPLSVRVGGLDEPVG